jgi:hypothetical protein
LFAQRSIILMLIAPDSQRLMLLPGAFQCLAVLSSGIRCKRISPAQLALCLLQHGVFLLLQRCRCCCVAWVRCWLSCQRRYNGRNCSAGSLRAS